MDKDVVPELLETIKKEFEKEKSSNNDINQLLKLLDKNNATYLEANKYAIEIGELLSKVLTKNINAEILPDGKMYFNIANRIMNETLQNNYELISDYAENVQSQLNKKANLRVKSKRPPINQDRIDGIVNRISSEELFDDIKWILGEPIVNFSQSIVDDSIEENVKFHYEIGLDPEINRIAVGKACKWCKELEGRYRYPNKVPKDVYHRHENCRCMVDYNPKDGRGIQDIWSKLWRKKEREHKANKRIKKDILLAEVTKLKKDIRNLDMTTAKPSDIIELGKRVNYYFNVSDNLGNKEKLKEIFSNFREIGGNIPEERWHQGSNKTVSKQIQNALSYYPKDWANYLASNNKTIFAGKTERGFFANQLVESNGYFITGAKRDEGISIYTDGIRKTTPFHEIGHMVEYFNPDVLRIEKEWINSRTAGEGYTRLKDIFPRSKYKSKEVTKKDNFISPYIGKSYDDATEVLSMGLESMFEPGIGQPKCYIDGKIKYSKITEDEEYLNLILGLFLKG